MGQEEPVHSFASPLLPVRIFASTLSKLDLGSLCHFSPYHGKLIGFWPSYRKFCPSQCTPASFPPKLARFREVSGRFWFWMFWVSRLTSGVSGHWRLADHYLMGDKETSISSWAEVWALIGSPNTWARELWATCSSSGMARRRRPSAATPPVHPGG